MLFSCVFGCAGSAVWIKGQPDPEADPLPEVFHRAGASVGCDSGLYNGKSQPGSAAFPAAGAVAPEEGFPEMGEILLRDAAACVVYSQADTLPAGLHRDSYASALIYVVQRIAYIVCQHLLDLKFIRIHQHRDRCV